MTISDRMLPVEMALLIRFGLVGLLNTVFGYGIYALFILAGFWPGAALVLGMLAGAAFNFQTARRLVFRSQGRLARFIASYALILALNWILLRLLLHGGLSELVGQAVLALPMAAFSFWLQRRFVFAAP